MKKYYNFRFNNHQQIISLNIDAKMTTWSHAKYKKNEEKPYITLSERIESTLSKNQKKARITQGAPPYNT
jgi:hypothetical protein